LTTSSDVPGLVSISRYAFMLIHLSIFYFLIV